MEKRGQKVLKTAQSLISSVPFSFFFAGASKIETCAFKWFPFLKTDTQRNFCSHTIFFSPIFSFQVRVLFSLACIFSRKCMLQQHGVHLSVLQYKRQHYKRHRCVFSLCVVMLLYTSPFLHIVQAQQSF